MAEEALAEIEKKLPISKSEADVARRNEYWQAMDLNKNGYLSLAETEKGLRDVICIPQLFEAKPVIKQAFDSAKSALKSKNPHGDDYVSKGEFKYLIFYLRLYYQFWVMFDKVDTDKDRKISLAEFSTAAPLLEQWGFPLNSPEESFKELDTDNDGCIVFEELASWALRNGPSME